MIESVIALLMFVNGGTRSIVFKNLWLHVFEVNVTQRDNIVSQYPTNAGGKAEDGVIFR